MLSTADIISLKLTIEIASLSTLFILLLGTPLAWWLVNTRSRWKQLINALIALPLVLPPTVLGFYLLLIMGPSGWIGRLTQLLGWGLLPFSFSGLIMASMLYSLPFVVQPLQTAFTAIGQLPLEAAATLGANPLDRFFTIVIPLAKSGFLTAGILGFTHTIGEFGVVLMVGGNIPNQTQVVSVQIYNHVEALEYTEAHQLASVLLLFSLFALILLYTIIKNPIPIDIQ
jgi:molybdate transport system permease protein